MLRIVLHRAQAAASEAALMIGAVPRDWYVARSVGLVVAGFGATLAAEYLLMLSDYELSGIVPMRHALARPVVTLALVTAWGAASWGWERLTWCGFYPGRVWRVLRYGPRRRTADDEFTGEE
jgi:hypothetical protein